MATPDFIHFTTNIAGYSSARQNMSSSRPSAPLVSSNSAIQGQRGEADSADMIQQQQAAATAAVSASTATQELDTLYEKLSNASLALKNLDPTMPQQKDTATSKSQTQTLGDNKTPQDISVSASVSSPAAADLGALSPKDATEEHAESIVRGPSECDPACACQRVLLAASPGVCGLCSGRPQVLAKQNDERLKALDDLEIASQRINELAHEKARHVDYIADLETRSSDQARKIDSQRDIIAGLKNDLSAMNDKFVDQVNMTAEIAHSRELVEAELEDLTQKLFTEANTMVSAEKKARFEAEKTTAHLRNIIADMEVRLANETLQSQELKERIEKMSAEYDELVVRRNIVSSRRGSFSSHHSDIVDIASMKRDGSLLNNSNGAGGGSGSMVFGVHGDGFRLGMHAISVMAGTKSLAGASTSGVPIRLDDVLFAEFRDFTTQTQSNRLVNYMTMPYIKNVVTEDIEPCLRFGPRPRISVRNVLEAISSNRLHVEEMSVQVAADMSRQQQAAERANGHRQAMLWERLSGSVAYNSKGCQACGRECQCTYRFRMGVKADSEWIQIDTVCRDRLVAVCEFYGFVRYLRQGIFASRSVMDLYMETIRLRLCMFYARIGSYGVAIDLDPNLNEATLFTRTPSMPPQPDSPSALNHMPSFSSQLSPLGAPYIHSQRATSAISVPWREPTPISMSQLAADSNDHVNRNRSKSQETPTMSSASGTMSMPLRPIARVPTVAEETVATDGREPSKPGVGSIAISVNSSISSIHSVANEAPEVRASVTSVDAKPGNSITNNDDDDDVPIISISSAAAIAVAVLAPPKADDSVATNQHGSPTL